MQPLRPSTSVQILRANCTTHILLLLLHECTIVL
uniref:Uncharacterized protein n=1 Tax=Arundo donax TaxID=35708 RepID=A0A0A9BJV0_ARUDO